MKHSDLPRAYVVDDTPLYTRVIDGEVTHVPPERAPEMGSLGVCVDLDPDGDLILLLDNGVFEALHPSCLRALDSDSDAARLRVSLWRHALDFHGGDPFHAADHYAGLLAGLKRRAAEAGKVCADCGERKPLREYHVRAKSPDGLQHICMDCVLRRNAERYRARNANL